MRAQICGDPEYIWNKLAYSAGLHAQREWWDDFARERFNFEILLHSISGGTMPSPIEVVRLDTKATEILV